MFPVSVDFPESTWPMKTKFAFYLLKFLKSVYLSTCQSFLAINSAVVVLGSYFLIIYYYFGFYYRLFGYYLGC